MFGRFRSTSLSPKIFIILWTSFGIALLTLGISFFALTVLSDTKWVKDSVLDHLEQMIGGPIQIETLNIDLFPFPAVDVKGVTLETPTQAIFHAKGIEVGIGWQSLWQGNIFVNHILVDEPDLTIEVPLATTSEEPIMESWPAIQELTIRNGGLHLLRRSSDQTKFALNVELIQLTLAQTKLDEPSAIQLSAEISDTQMASGLRFNGTLMYDDLHGTVPINEEMASIPTFVIQGHIEGTHLNLSRLVQFANGQTIKPTIHTETNVQGNISYTFQQDTDHLRIENVHIALDDWSFVGEGHLVDAFHEFPRMDISGSSSAVALEQLPRLLPHEWVPTELQTILREHKVIGNVELKRGSLQIPFNDLEKWNAEGIIQVKEGQFLPSPAQPLLTDISGFINFSPSALQFSEVHGIIEPFTITTSNATLNLQEDELQLSVPTIQISEGDWLLTGTVDFFYPQNSPPHLVVSASSRPISLQRLSRILPEPWLPPSVENIMTTQKIDGEIELVTGTVKWIDDEANTLLSEGVARIKKATIQIDPYLPPLRNVSGGIVFESDLFRFLEVEATIASSRIAVTEATLERKNSEYWMDLKGKGLFSAHDVHQVLLKDPRSQGLLPQLSLYNDAEGQFHVSTQIQVPLAAPSKLQILDGRLLLKDIHLFPSSHAPAMHQINAALSFKNQRVSIQRFNGQLGESPVDIKGQLSFQEESQTTNVTMISSLSPKDLQDFFPAIREKFSTNGPIQTTVSFSGSAFRPEYQATFDFTNTALIVNNLFQKPLGIPATLKLKGSMSGNTAIRMTQGILSIPPYTLEAQGQFSWSDPPYIRVHAQTESGTGAIFPDGVTIGDDRLRLSSLGITWGLEGRNWDWTRWAMKGKVEGSNRNSQTTTSNTNEDMQLASLQWAQKNQKGKGEITLKRIPIESLLSSQSASPSPLTGTTSLTTSLHMNLENSEQTQRSLTGEGTVQLQKGLIQSGPVLTKILGILNVPSLLMGKVNLLEEGLPYDELKGSFSLNKGLLTTEDLALKSPVIKLTAAGRYDLPSEYLDSMVAVSPFGAYSNLLKDIPLFGSLMQGERKGILTALFEVKGPRTNPEVTYLPIESLTGGLKGFAQFPIDMLKNIVTLPIPDKKKPEPVASP